MTSGKPEPGKSMTGENKFIVGLVAFLAIGTLLDAGTTDGIFVSITVGFFALCIAYAEWCARL